MLRFGSRLKELKLLSPFMHSSLPTQVKFKTRLNACIHLLSFLRRVAKRKRAEALFALLFASLAILQLVYAL